MNEYKTIDSLFKKFANPIKEDYEALAVSLMKNFSITKCEKDSEGMFQWQSAISNTQQRVTQQHITQQRVTQTFSTHLPTCRRHVPTL